jgi:hypothetical protein
MTTLLTRTERMEHVRKLIDQVIPDPHMRLTMQLAVSDFGLICASEALDDYMAQRERLRQIGLPFGER